MSTTTVERTHINAWIDPRDDRRLVALARTHDRSFSAELRRAIRAHVEMNEDEEEQR